MSDVTSGDSNYSSSDFSGFSDEDSSTCSLSLTDIDSDVPLAVYAKHRRQTPSAALAPFQW